VGLGAALQDLGGAWSLRYALQIEPIGWSVMAEAHLLDALRRPALALARGLAVTLALAALFGAVAYRRSTHLLRPLWVLYEAMYRSERGQVVEDVPARGAAGEVKSLIHVFNSLHRRLEAQRIEMERANRALNEQNQAFQEKHQTLSKLSVTDSLTKLANRRFFENQLDREIKRLSRSSEGLSMLVIDIDDFKKLNDSFGHAAGDEFLRQIATILTEGVRATDLVARYGGEEFVVVATGTALEGAEILGEKLRTVVAEASFIVDESMRPRRATISVGVAEYSGSQIDLFNSADAALYEAKAQGKNCVCTAPRSPEAGDENGDVG
jgi:diguanylate cyclase (GGDEF)-like protein